MPLAVYCGNFSPSNVSGVSLRFLLIRRVGRRRSTQKDGARRLVGVCVLDQFLSFDVNCLRAMDGRNMRYALRRFLSMA